jgi:integration host factor subunit alpha
LSIRGEIRRSDATREPTDGAVIVDLRIDGERTMTKAEIVEQIYERVGFSKKEAAELVEKVFEIMKETLAEGEKVKISGFGNFVVREKNARKGRNPQTGQEILLDARRVLTFKPSLVLKNVLNETEVTDADRAALAESDSETSDLDE